MKTYNQGHSNININTKNNAQTKLSSSEEKKTSTKIPKSTTLLDNKNVVRWRVPNATLERPSDRESSSKKGMESMDRPRSAPSSITSSSLSPSNEKILRRVTTSQPNISDIQKSKDSTSLHKRHWMYLFENLHRAVDEMYKNCEQDFSIEECTNVLHTLELCMEDFKRLISKIQVLSDYEEVAKSKPGPVSVAWEEPCPQRLSPHSPRTPLSPIAQEIPWAERLKRSLNIQHRIGSSGSTIDEGANSQNEERSSLSILTPQFTPDNTSHSPPRAGQYLLQKFSSPESKKRSPEEAKQLQDERQAKASKKREELVSAKKEKAALAFSRLKEASERHNKLIAKRQLWIDEKQEKAGQLHDAHIHHIKRKATAENMKVNEVVWIANQSAETRKYVHQKKLEGTAVRRQELAEEKRKKRIEAAAKEEAAAERRKQIEHAKVMMSKGVSQSGNERPASNVSKKVSKSGSHRAVQANSSEHSENGKKSQKLTDKSAIVLGGESARTEGNQISPADANEIKIINELEHNQRKRAKRTKQRISQIALSYVDPGIHPPRESPHKARVLKLVQDLRGILTKKNFQSMQSVLGHISRILMAKGEFAEIDLQVFRQIGGLEVLLNICSIQGALTPASGLAECLSLLSVSCTQVSNRLYIISTGRLLSLVDLLGHSILSNSEVAFMPSVITLLTLHLWQPVDNNDDQMKGAIILYAIQTCLFEKMQFRLARLHQEVALDSVNNPIPSPAVVFVEKIVEFLEAVSASVQSSARARPVLPSPGSSAVETPIIEVFKKTNLVGVISVLASLLLQNKPTRAHSSPPPPMANSTWSIIFSTVKVLNNIATLDLVFLQNFLGSDDYQVEMFHLFGHFLWYCTSTQDDESSLKRSKLLHEIILLAGYYSLQNSRAQDVFQWGNSPTILQQLCSLPFQYFSDLRYKSILFPTLIAVCFENSKNSMILQQEVSANMLIDYLLHETSIIGEYGNNSIQVPPRFLLKNRLPQILWEKAIQFFMESK